MDNQETARILSQADQLQAIIASTGDAFGQMHARLVHKKVPRHVANKIVEDAAHQWYAGTFNRKTGLTLPGMP